MPTKKGSLRKNQRKERKRRNLHALKQMPTKKGSLRISQRKEKKQSTNEAIVDP